MKTILILGGNGFIGQHITKKCINRGYDIYNISLNDKRVLYNKDKVDNFYCDILDIDKLKKCKFKNIQFNYIINCMGFGDHSRFREGGIKVIKTHFVGLINMLELINWDGIEGFIQLGTSDAYGDYPAPQEEKFREKSISPYSASKTAAAHLLQMLYITESFPAKILRLFLPFGPGQDINMLLPQVIVGCLKNRNFPVSFGEQYRDFLYIDDLVDAILLALTNSKANGELINIASGSPVKIKTLVNKVRSIIGTGNPKFGKYPYRDNENMELFANIEKAKRILGWVPKTYLDTGLKKTIEYYKNDMLGFEYE